jgi:hypothetical protein
MPGAEEAPVRATFGDATVLEVSMRVVVSSGVVNNG